jgi:hypothetical protein
MPPHSTPHPQEEGILRSSSCLCRVLGRPLPLLPPTPTTVANARVRERGRGKGRTTTLMAPATTVGAPQRGPPSTITELAPSQCGQECVLHSSSQCVHCIAPSSLHRCTTGLPVTPPSRPCLRLHRTSTRSWPLSGHPRWTCGINSH